MNRSVKKPLTDQWFLAIGYFQKSSDNYPVKMFISPLSIYKKLEAVFG